ncbi:MAG TPA: cysteine desulfurase family protein [Hyphomonadaceae bacterium]|jgi:cysteine desulfurase|nr:cysteine desulfurase family protein [Hyphomonadaceae bacterium]HPI50257.1 cysteine desulfurase family protein [Hyphomonadaceae bacterium]
MSSGPRIYADYNATAPLRPEAKAAMVAALSLTGNPSSVHAEGRKARALVEGAREAIAAAIGACRDDIAFTGGGTEAAQAPLRGSFLADGRLCILVSRIEHDAVEALASDGDDYKWFVASNGVVDLDSLKTDVETVVRLGLRPIVSLMLVNNETGVIQPVAEAAEIVHKAGGLIHCDAIQALGKIPVSIIDLDVDYLSLSAHKIGGPQGMGAFYVKPGASFSAIQTGGGQEFGRRSGTENVAGIAGFAAAVTVATSANGLGAYQALAEHRDRMEEKLKAAAPSLQVHGSGAARVAGVSCFGVEGLPSETQIMGLDLAGFAVSAGSACSSGKVKPSRVLTAMGLGDTAARSAIRASFGWATVWQDFDALAEAWIRHAARARPQLVKLDTHV